MRSETTTDPALAALLEYLKRTRGFEFTAYKPATLLRRLHKRLHAVGIESFEHYQDYLEVHPEEFAQLFNAILINVTAFFRDEPAWDSPAETNVLPRIVGAGTIRFASGAPAARRAKKPTRHDAARRAAWARRVPRAREGLRDRRR